MGSLHLALLGGFRAAVDGQAVERLPTRKARALLAILATAPEYSAPRERLAAMLWERSAEEQARSSLRQTLASARKAIAGAGAHEVLRADAERVWLVRDRCRVDAREFESVLADGHAGSLDDACRRYTGDFLLGLSLRENAFENWLAEQRRHFQDLARQAFSRLLEHCMEAGDFRRGSEIAARLLAIDPLQEPVHRALMKIHAAQGHRSLALRQFDTCRELLARELDVAPEAETRALAESIRKERADSGPRTTPAPGDSSHAEAEASSETDSERHAVAGTAAFAGEIRPVTVLFARFSESSDDNAPPDPERHHRLGRAFQDAADAAVSRYGGRVDNRLGDSVIALFGVPVAHGNDAERALRAAMDLRAATPAIAAGDAHAVSAHVGVSAGRVVVGADDAGRGGYAIAGDSVEVAHRLEHASAAGEVLATEAVAAEAARFVDSQPATSIELSAGGRRLAVHSVQALRDRPLRWRPTRLVGRDVEMAQIRSVLDASSDPARAHIVYVRGEPGIGKTRLLEETAAIAEARGFACYRTLILDFGTSKSEEVQSSLARGLLDLAPGAGEAERSRVVARAIDEERTSAERRVFLNDLLDVPQPLELKSRFDAMDDAIRNQGRADVLADLIRHRCGLGPVLVMLEDLHWADPPVIERLAHLASALESEPVFFLMTSRVEGDPLDQHWRTATREIPLITIDLRPLSETDAARLASDISSRSEQFLQRCVARAQGNPLFLEQLLRATSEDDTIDAIPSSVQQLALSRSDRLEARDRDALRAASVLGQRFEDDALRSILRAPDYTCTELVNHDLVRPERDGYLFAHALIRDGIYASLLSETRRTLHLGAAEWFEHRDPGLHANHLEAAGDARAPEAYLKAARGEFQAYRVERALRLVERGIVIAQGVDRCRLLNLQGEIYYYVGPVSSSLQAYRETLAVQPDEAEKCRALVGMAMALRTIDDYEGAIQALDAAEPIAEARDLWESLARIYITRANLAFWKGHTDKCLPFGERALEHASRAGSVELETHALGAIGDAVYARGRMRSAHDHFLRCIDAARRNGLGRIEAAHRCQTAGGTLTYTLELRRSLAESIEAKKFSADIGSLRSEIQSCLSASNAAYFLGELTEARRHADDALRLAERLGAERTRARYHHYIGRILIAEGNREDARESLEEAFRISQETGTGYAGASIDGALARTIDDPLRRREVLEHGEKLLAQGAIGHNFIEFYDDAMEACLENEAWDEALRYAGLLEAYVGEEQLPFTDLIIARGRALAAVGGGERHAALAETLRRLVETAKEHGLALVIPAMERALDRILS